MGIGLRHEFANDLIADETPNFGFVEIHPENYIGRGGQFREHLECTQSKFPILAHGLTMGFGNKGLCIRSEEEKKYTRTLKEFLHAQGALWYSDHLCFTGDGTRFLHDLCPIPFTKNMADVCADNVKRMQDTLGIPVAVENISHYVDLTPADAADGMFEAEFVMRIVEQANAKVMLDVNNVFVNSRNYGFDPKDWFGRIDLSCVIQMHIAGHFVREDKQVIDTHGEPVCDDVKALWQWLKPQFGSTHPPLILERDMNIPSYDALKQELASLA